MYGADMKRQTLVIVMWLVLLAVTSTYAVPPGPLRPSRQHKCPVCGMFVAKYPDWVTVVTFTDGSVVFFDGVKDLFKYAFNLKKYSPGKTRANINAIYVTEYYNVELIAASGAYYVIGSDVYGPMGRELIPFASLADAEAFMRDHKGKRVLRFGDITPQVISTLD
jgi:copper chaperone NosL